MAGLIALHGCLASFYGYACCQSRHDAESKSGESKKRGARGGDNSSQVHVSAMVTGALLSGDGSRWLALRSAGDRVSALI